MKLERSTWISIAIAIAICAITVLWQRTSISAMNESVGALQAQLDSSELSLQGKGGRSQSLALPSAIAKETGETSDRPPQAVRPSLEEIISQLPEGTSDPSPSFRMMPKLLESFADYSIDDLFATFAELENLSADPNKRNTLGFLHSILQMVVADVAPARLMEMAEEKNDPQLRSLAFTSLLRKDITKASEMLASVDWPEHEFQLAESVLMSAQVRELVEKDVPAALEFMRENKDHFHYSSGAVIGVAVEDETVRLALWDALQSEEDSVLQAKLTRGLFRSAFMRDGLDGARQALEQAPYLDENLRVSIIEETADNAMRADADAAYEWIRESSLPPERVGESLSRAVGNWAREDFNAAGTWLGAQESSPERDRAMKAFARTVVDIDPAAAAIWANVIEDPTIRRDTLDSILSVWDMTDSEAVDAWAEENDVDTARSWIRALQEK